MCVSTSLGFPRIGENRELKKATELYWAGKITEKELLETGKSLRLRHWQIQKEQGLDVVPSNDFSFYDQVLDQSFLFNVIPQRYLGHGLSPLEILFAMGRGLQRDGIDVVSQEMVKWFDSNYHILRPEFDRSTEFKINATKPVDEFLEAKAAGIHTRPVLIGPVTFLHIGKASRGATDFVPIDLINNLLPVYAELLNKLADAGADWVQIDEPILSYDLPARVVEAYKPAYEIFHPIFLS